MKKLLFILLFPSLLYGQSVPVSLVSLSTVSDLRLQTPQNSQMVQLLGLTSINDTNGGTYYWNSASTASDNGFITIQVTGISTGRWVRLGNGNTIKGTATFSGVSLTTSYTVPYQQGTLPFVPISVIVTPRSANAAALSYISNITNTGFTIVFLTIPVLGTNNIVFDYVVIKQ